MLNDRLRARGGDIRVARVLNEDETFLTLELAKHQDRPLEVREGDTFLTVLFVHQVDGKMEAWLPWEG